MGNAGSTFSKCQSAPVLMFDEAFSVTWHRPMLIHEKSLVRISIVCGWKVEGSFSVTMYNYIVYITSGVSSRGKWGSERYGDYGI